MKDALENSREELKRIDHLIYVTLKYTRTVDVFISILERMINSYDFIVEALLKKAIEEGKIADIPDLPLTKAEIAAKNYESRKIKDHIKKYLLFRKLIRSDHEKSNEFRRHVTMTARVDDKEIKVNIDNITEDYHKLKDFVEYIQKMLLEE
jgi:hypothetical protein